MKWTDQQVKYLIDNYLISDYKSIAKALNINYRAVGTKISSLGLKKGRGPNIKYPINSTYFDNWSNDMAYILGYIMADGCVTDDYRLILQCQYKDKEILEYIQQKLSPTRPLQIAFKKRPRDKRLCKVVRFEFKDIYLVNRLNLLNIVPRKTGVEILPDIPNKYKSDYLRGYFDGDGCIHYGSYLDKRDGKYYKQQSLTLCSGGPQFLEEIKSQLCFGYGYVLHRKNDVGDSYVLRTANKNEIIKLGQFMYHNTAFYLERKYQKFIDLGLFNV